MSKRQFGITLVVFGALVLIGAAFAYAYEEFGEEFIPGYNGSEPYFRGLTVAPYRDYAFPLILGGVALFMVGLTLIYWGGLQKKEKRSSL
jgi:hypothetical protein